MSHPPMAKRGPRLEEGCVDMTWRDRTGIQVSCLRIHRLTRLPSCRAWRPPTLSRIPSYTHPGSAHSWALASLCRAPWVLQTQSRSPKATPSTVVSAEKLFQAFSLPGNQTSRPEASTAPASLGADSACTPFTSDLLGLRALWRVSLLKVLRQSSAKSLQPRGQGSDISCFSLNPLNRTEFHEAGWPAAGLGDWHGFIKGTALL